MAEKNRPGSSTTDYSESVPKRRDAPDGTRTLDIGRDISKIQNVTDTHKAPLPQPDKDDGNSG